MSAPEPAEMELTPPRRGLVARLGGISTVWLVPLAALIVALGVAWSAYSSRGPLIVITFSTAEGIAEGVTTLKFREVDVGRVESVQLSEELDQVLVGVRVEKEIAAFLDEDANFWIVQPEVSARGISGLETVLSGVYIQGDWDANVGEPVSRFEALDRPPLRRDGRDGIEITLRAPGGGRIESGAPIIYRGITVGQLETPRLLVGGDAVIATAFIEAPYDRLLSTASRFWGASGFSVSVGAGGLSVDVASLAALLEGGVGFSTMVSGGEPVEPGQIFDVYASEEEARAAVFEAPVADTLRLAILFDDSLAGLKAGASVEYRGVRVGTVDALSAQIEGSGRDQHVRLRADVALLPERLGLPDIYDEERALTSLSELVEGGLRARLASDGLLGINLKIELVELPEAEPAALTRDAGGRPLIPSVPPNLADVTASAQGVLDRIGDLPIETLLQQAGEVLVNINRILASEDAQAAPEAVLALLTDARGLLSPEAAGAVLDQLSAVSDEATAALADLRAMLARLEEGAAINSVIATLERADRIAASVETAAEGLPELMREINGLAAEARSLPLEQLVGSANDLVQTADGLIGSDDAAQIPAALTAALDELGLALAELRDGGAVANANETLASATAAAAAIEDAATDLPVLTARIDALVADSTRVLGTYGERSEFNAQTLAMLRDLRDAARAVTSLARTIERNPDALLRGR